MLDMALRLHHLVPHKCTRRLSAGDDPVSSIHKINAISSIQLRRPPPPRRPPPLTYKQQGSRVLTRCLFISKTLNRSNIKPR
ncbi:hypothetical protein GDO81_026715 [Engystomops pustulosus]|uniref:Uncharacterized protein n=1 Tax=Engystomops pustulosus TaxID=76066 RepID=A0AAV6ZPF4_ENGPU|nr:hypothetical protein GDO81_026715 [Engystomops pustulosus]